MSEDEIKEWINDNLLTKQEVMDNFKISSVNFDNYVRRSKLKPFIKKGPRINLYLKREVENFLENTSSNQWSTIKLNRKKQIKKITFADIDASNTELQEVLTNIITKHAKSAVTGHIQVSDIKNEPQCGKRTDYSFSKEDINNLEFQKYIKATLIQKSKGISDKELSKIVVDTSYTYSDLKKINLSCYESENEFVSNADENEKREFINFLNQPVTFSELVKEIKSYVRLNFLDPKGEHSERTKKLIKANGFKNPDDFLNEYIYK